MNTPGSSATLFHANAIAEQRAAGERRRRIDGDDADREPRVAVRAREQRRERALARARRAGDADAPRAADPRLQAREQRVESGAMILDDADRARERGLPSRVEIGEETVSWRRWRSGAVISCAAARARRARRECRRRAPRADPRASRGRSCVAQSLRTMARCCRSRSMRKSSSLQGAPGAANATGRNGLRRVAVRFEDVERVHHADDVDRASRDRSARGCSPTARSASASVCASTPSGEREDVGARASSRRARPSR